MRRLILCLALVVVFSFCVGLAAQAEEVLQAGESDDSLLADLSKRVKFNGSLDLTYWDYEGDGYKDGVATFDLFEAYVAASGEIAQDLNSYLEIRYEHGGDEIELRQGYMDWSIIEPVTARFGKFYMPIGIYRIGYYNSLRKFVSVPLCIRLVSVIPWSDTGMELYGDIPISQNGMSFKYELAIVNGLNDEYVNPTDQGKVRAARQNMDNNTEKTIGGRIGFLPIEGLELGFSYNTGKYDDEGRYNLEFIAGDIAYTVGDLTIKGEYVQSTAETSDDDITTDGYYIEASYIALKEFWGMRYLEVAARYETIDPGQDLMDRFLLLEGQEAQATSLALNISPKKHFLFKFEYQFNTEDEPDLDNNAFLGQIVVDF
ncbi:MAG: porin [Nitrospirota bacterium]